MSAFDKRPGSRQIATILLVEDNPDHAEVAIKALQKDTDTIEVLLAKDGEEALDLLARRGPDGMPAPRIALILLDIHLPKITGHEVLRRIKADPELRSIPVVMLTTSGRSDDVDASYEAGANSYVEKPVSFWDFLERVNAVKEYWLKTNALPKPRLAA
jgi:CheY-like chemotaxis protein